MAKTDTKKQEKAFTAVLKKAKSAYKGDEVDELEPIARESKQMRPLQTRQAARPLEK